MDATFGRFIAIMTALTGLLTAAAYLISLLRTNTKTTNQTALNVNNTHDTLITRIAALEGKILGSGGTIPIDPEIAAAQARIDAHITTNTEASTNGS